LDNIVTMTEQTSQILRSYYKQKCQEGDEESQKCAIIETAARLIRSDIKSQVSTVTNQYPSSEDLKLDSALLVWVAVYSRRTFVLKLIFLQFLL